MRNPEVQVSLNDGCATLRGPANFSGLFGRLMARSVKDPVYKTFELEEVGTFVWNLIDGKRTFSALSKSLQKEYVMGRLEAEASLEAFLGMLAERGLVTMMVPKR